MRNWDRKGRPAPTGEQAAAATLPGVIDTLGLGYAALIARPIIMTPLLSLECAILFSPRVILRPLGDLVAGSAANRGNGWGVIRSTAERLSSVNLVEWSALQLPIIRTPVFVPNAGDATLASVPWNVSFSSLPSVVLMALAALSIVVGLLISAALRTALAAGGVGVGSTRDALNPRFLLLMSLRLAGWAMALIGLLVLVAMPVIVVTGIGMIFGFGGSQILWLIVLLPAAWGFVHFFFSLHALFVDRSGPFEALRSSYLVVRGDFWQSVQFIAITMLITTGLTFALRQMAVNAGGIFIGIAINTFVVAGIIVAAMLFYRDRARLLGLPDHASGK